MKVTWSQLYWFNARLGLGPFLGGIPYFRWLEYPLAIGMAGDLEGKRILDIGSGRRGRFPLFLLTQLDKAEIHSTDLEDYQQEQYLRARKLGLGAEVGRRFFVEQQDTTSLTYLDTYFDRVFAISTLEHIPENGDMEAMAEISRVLRPGGLAVVAVPFRTQGYKEEFRNTDVSFHRHQDKVFYERKYDIPALHQRLTEPSGLKIDRLTFYGERGFRFWNALYSRILPLPVYWQWLTLPFRLTMPLLASKFLSVLPDHDLEFAEGVIFAGQRT